MNDISNVISSLGFPIACCVGMGFYLYKDRQKEREENTKREERLFNTIDGFASSMDNLNGTLKGIDERLTRLENKA